MPLIFIAPLSYSITQPGGGAGGGSFINTNYDYYYSNVSALLHAELTAAGQAFVDEAGGSFTNTGAALTTTVKKFGNASMYFSGTNGSHIDAATATAYALSTLDFTVETWVNLTSLFGGAGATSGSQFTICDLRSSSSQASALYVAIPYSGNSVIVYIGTTSVTLTAPFQFTPGVWYHLAVMRSAGTLYVTVNGNVIGAFAGQGASLGTTQPIRLGANQASATNNGLYGYLDEFRMTKNVARYAPSSITQTGPFTSSDPYYGNVVALLHFDGANNDTTTSDDKGHKVVMTNATLSTTQKKYGTTSLAVNSATNAQSGVILGPGIDFTLSGDFTIEAWVYPTSLATWDAYGGPTLLSFSSGGSSASINSVILALDPSTQKMKFTYSGNNPGFDTTIVDPYGLVTINSWHHVAVCRKGTTAYMFIDGQLVGTDTTSSSAVGSSTWVLSVGCQYYTDSQRPWRGYIDEVRITKDVARYVTNFNPTKYVGQTLPPTSAFDTTDRKWANVSSLLHMEGTNGSTTILDEKGNLFTASGGATLSTGASKFGSSSAYFNAQGAYIKGPGSINAFGTGDFTIELWFNATQLPGTQANGFTLFEGRPDSSNGAFPTISIGSGGTALNYVVNGAVLIATTVALSTGIWYHVALRRSSSVTSLFLNGTCIGYANDTTNYTAGQLMLGANAWRSSAPDTNFFGYIDEVRVTSGFGRYVPNLPALASPNNGLADTLSPSTLMDVALTGTVGMNNKPVLDASPNALIPVNNGTVTQGSFHPHGSQWGAYFDGSSYITCPDNAAFALGSSDFTIEGWFNFTSNATIQTLFGQWNFVSSDSFLCQLNGTLLNFLYSVDGSTSTTLSWTPGFARSTWYHVAFVRQGSALTLYVNGVSLGSQTLTGTLFDSTDSFYVGGQNPTVQQYPFTGYMHSFRMVKGTAVYTTTFTPPTYPLTTIAGTSVLMFTSNSWTDLSSNNIPLTLVGVPRLTKSTPYALAANYAGAWSSTASAYYDGGARSLSMLGNAAFAFGTGDFTVECFMNFQGYVKSPNYAGLFDTRASNGSGGFVFALSPGNLLSAGDGTTMLTAGTAFTPNQWIHVAVSRQGSTMRLFVNGTQVGSGSITTNYTSTSTALIGNAWDGYQFNGWLSNMRVVKGTALYTANFTVPTLPLPLVSGTSLLALQEHSTDQLFLDTAKLNPLTNNGVVLSSAAPTALTGNGSLHFDGLMGSYLSTTYVASQFDWWTSDYTLECWVYPTASTGYLDSGLYKSVMLGNRNVSSTSDYWSFGPNQNNKLVFYYYSGTSVMVTSNASVPVGAWTHIALTKDSGGIHLWINGVLDTTAAISGTPQSSSSVPLSIGQGNGTLFKGYVTDLRVLKGTAVYTTAFTPPTNPLTAVANTQLLLQGANAVVYDNVGRSNITLSNVSVDVEHSRTGRCLSFTGSGYAMFSNVPSFGQGDFTAECWVNFNAISNVCLFDQWVATSPNYVVGQWQLFVQSNTALSVSVAVSTSSVTNYSASISALTTGSWNHIAVVRASGVLTLWVNGTAYLLSSTSTEVFGTSAYPMDFGYQRLTANDNLNGYVEGIRYTNAARDIGLMFTYDQNSLWPTSTIPNSSDPDWQNAEYWNEATVTALDFESNMPDRWGRVLTPVGNASLSSTQKKFGTASLYCPGGTESGLTLEGHGYFLNTLLANFTFEVWAYPTSISASYNSILYSQPEFNVMLNTIGQLVVAWFDQSSTADTLTSTAAVTLNAWSHIAFVRDINTYSIYVNGVRVGTKTSAITVLRDANNIQRIGHYGDGLSYWKGYIDDLKITNVAKYKGTYYTVPTAAGTNRYDLDASVDTYWRTVALHLHAEDYRDSSSFKFRLTRLGAMLSSAQYKFGTSSFDCSAGGLSLGTNPVFTLREDFTLEAWVYPTTIAGTGSYGIYSQGESAGTQVVSLEMTNNGHLRFLVASTSTLIDMSSSSLLTANAWNHVSVTRTDSSIRMFINGVQVATAAYSGSLPSLSSTVYVGQRTTYGSPFPGYLDEVRISNGVARYTAAFSVPTVPFPNSDARDDTFRHMTVLRLDMEGTDGGAVFTDSSFNACAVTAYSSTTSAASSAVGNTSAYFSNSGATYLSVAHSPDQNINNGTFTIEMWVNPTVIPASASVVSGKWANGNTAISAYGFNMLSGVMRFVVAVGSSSYFVADISTMSPNTWYHFAVVISGGTMYLYRNGVQVSSAAYSGTINTSTLPFTVGRVLNADGVTPDTTYPFTGYVDEVRITKYARYFASFTPMAMPSTAIAPKYDPHWQAVVALLGMEGTNGGSTFTDSKGNTVSLYGSPVTSTTKFRIGTSSAYFNGSSALTMASSSVFNFGINDWTIEFWAYCDAPNGSILFQYGNYMGAGGPSWNLSVNSSGSVIWTRYPASSSAGAGVNTANNAFYISCWNHLAVIKRGGYIHLYVNGRRYIYIADDILNWVNTDGVRIGAGDDATSAFIPANFFTGYIDSVRVTKGVARYEGDFIPHTWTLPTQN